MRVLVAVLCVAYLLPPQVAAQKPGQALTPVEAVEAASPQEPEQESEVAGSGQTTDGEMPAEGLNPGVTEEASDSILVEVRAPGYSPEYGLRRPFNPNPTRAVWLSALCPGFGQVYNRRYWKLPIIIAGFMGLGYGTSWNNTQYNDYAKAYSDLMDADPGTNSYMDFFPPTTTEGDLDRTWLANTLKSRKNYYRRNRELCIICMVGVYLLCMIDAYVDATMAHFDISPDLSLDVQPALFAVPGQHNKPAMGIHWALNF